MENELRLWEQGLDLVKGRQYSRALPIFEQLATSGYWELYAVIGDILFTGGADLERDPSRAITFYRKAIFEGDDPYGHLGLGRALFLGSGVERDPFAAENHLRRALLNSVPSAELLLGRLLVEKHRVDGKFLEAEQLLTSAANEGYVAAHSYLAEIDNRRGRILAAAWKSLRTIFLCMRVLRSNPDSPKLEGMFPMEKPGAKPQLAAVVDLAERRKAALYRCRS